MSLSLDYVTDVKAADVDNDGDIDCVVAAQDDDQVKIFENDGSQSFSQRVVNPNVNGPRGVFIYDVDGDGSQDLLSASIYDNTIHLYLNDGYQSFSIQELTTTATGAMAVHASDVYGDGDVDVVAGRAESTPFRRPRRASRQGLRRPDVSPQQASRGSPWRLVVSHVE